MSAEELLKAGSNDVAWRQFGDEIVMLDLRTSTYIATNDAATVLWGLLEKGTTRSELVAALVEAYGIDGARAGADVDAFVAECRRRDLLVDATP